MLGFRPCFHRIGKPNTSITIRRFLSDEHASDRVPVRKGAEYYEQQQLLRRYYYVIDTRGGVYLEDSIPRNIATSLKDKRFLSFFHSQMRRNNTGIHEDVYPYVSLCGKEVNFVLPLDCNSAFVYTELSPDKTILYYGGNVADASYSSQSKAGLASSFGSALFEPRLLSFNIETGRLYYPIMNHKFLNLGLDVAKAIADTSFQFEYALLHPHLCQQLGMHINYDDDMSSWCFSWNNSTFKLRVFD
jgi:hypothetical protein